MNRYRTEVPTPTPAPLMPWRIFAGHILRLIAKACILLVVATGVWIAALFVLAALGL